MTMLLPTKLQQPTYPAKHVERPQLIDRLNIGLESGHHVFLVSAPAGFGKTVCISEWVRTLDLPFAWLSLDSADDDPGRFFTYFIAALQNLDDQIGHEIEGILRAGQLPPEEIISITLINDILNTQKRFLVVLDDFQVIQDVFILTALEKLIANLPGALCLALLTREDPSLPLARLRANNQMTEIRAGDLRFSIQETEQFLENVMGLSLSQDDIYALEAKAEGWAAGLLLAGLSIRSQTSPSEFITKLSGSQRFILSYLTEEVLNQQPQDIQNFLMETSILDRLSADLCNAVTRRVDSATMLERLFADNLFIISLDEEGRWYRYHHLFADLLRGMQSRQDKEHLADLHRRATRWYAQTGMVNEAIQHALAGTDYETAIHLIETHAMDLLMQWHVKTVEGWMQAVPTEWIAQSPKANLVFAWLYLMRGNPAPAFPYLERLESFFTDQSLRDDPALATRWLALQAMLLNAQGKAAECLVLNQQALEIVPNADPLTRCQIYLGMANAYQQLNDYPHALEAFQQITQYSRQSGDSVSEMLGIAGMALFALQQGELHFAFDIVSEGVERMEHSGVLPPVSTALYGELGVIYYQWHQLEQAHENFKRSIKVSTLSGYADAELYYGVIISRLFQIEGDLENAASEIQKAVDLMHVEAPSVVAEEIIAQQVRVYLSQDRLAAAETALRGHGFSFGQPFSFPALEENITRPMGILFISALRIVLHRAVTKNEFGPLEQGIELAGRLIENALQHHHIPLALELLLLRAQLFVLLRNNQASKNDYLQALKLGEPEGFISVFVEGGPSVAQSLSQLLMLVDREPIDTEYIQRILDAFPATDPLALHAQVEPASDHDSLVVPLSERELEILQLIYKGLSNQEITEQLFITLHTVKKHSSNIYAKLGVSSRTQAVAMARQLGLL